MMEGAKERAVPEGHKATTDRLVAHNSRIVSDISGYRQASHIAVCGPQVAQERNVDFSLTWIASGWATIHP